MSSSSPTRPNPSGFPAPSVERLIAQFDNIRLAHRDTGFIGGFMPLHRTQGRSDDDKHPTSVPLCLRPGPRIMCQPASPSPTLPEPQPPRMYPATLAMPMPIPSMPTANVDQSLTMVYAKSAPPDINQYPPPYIRHQHHSSNPSSSPSSPQALSLIQTHTRASSTPPSQTSVTHSAGSGPTVQCNGMTKVGKRCNRVVKAAPLLSLFAPISSEPVERFCFQHVKELLAQSGFYSHKQGGGWVEFSKWIPDYLHPDTQTALRVEMEKPQSQKDEPGYIYAYEIRDDRTPSELKIKVGRAVKLVKRLDQWSKQCTSKEVILRGWWPGKVEDDDGSNGTSLLRGQIKAGEKGPLCHRLERLVHLELADLAVHAPYLAAGFPKSNTQTKTAKANGATAPSTPGHSPKPSKTRMFGKPCVDCGAIHKEIFTFQRVQKGRYKNVEWEQLVQPVITKWGRFVADYV